MVWLLSSCRALGKLKHFKMALSVAHFLIVSQVILELEFWLWKEGQDELHNNHKVLNTEGGESERIADTILQQQQQINEDATFCIASIHTMFDTCVILLTRPSTYVSSKEDESADLDGAIANHAQPEEEVGS